MVSTFENIERIRETTEQVMNWAAATEVHVAALGFLLYSQSVFESGPDYVLPVPNRTHAGLLIFMANGEATELEQAAWARDIEAAAPEGAPMYRKARVTGGAAGVIHVIKAYLEDSFAERHTH